MSQLIQQNQSAPNTPTSGNTTIYVDSVSKKLSTLDDIGKVTNYGDFRMCNYLMNGGLGIAQRQAPATLTTYAANTYSADRWKTYVENASYQYARQDGLSETGLTSQYFGAFKKITNTGKMFIYQIVEGINSVPLRGKIVTFQCQMKASSAKTI